MAVWEVGGETAVTWHCLRTGQGRRVRLSFFDRLRDQREEDALLLSELYDAPEEIVASEMLRRVFRAGRFPLPAVLLALELDIPSPIQRRVLGEPRLCEEVLDVVKEACEGWAEILRAHTPTLSRSASLSLAFDSFIAACHRRTLTVFAPQRFSLQYRPSEPSLWLVGVAEAPILLDPAYHDPSSNFNDPVTKMVSVVGKSPLLKTMLRVQRLFSEPVYGLDEVRVILLETFAGIDAEQRRQLSSSTTRSIVEEMVVKSEFLLSPQRVCEKITSLSGQVFDSETELEITAELTRDHFRRKCECAVAVGLMLMAKDDEPCADCSLTSAINARCFPRVSFSSE